MTQVDVGLWRKVADLLDELSAMHVHDTKTKCEWQELRTVIGRAARAMPQQYRQAISFTLLGDGCQQARLVLRHALATQLRVEATIERIGEAP